MPDSLQWLIPTLILVGCFAGCIVLLSFLWDLIKGLF